MFSTVGVCVIAHYCGGELEKVSLFSKPSSCCDGEDEETDDCCQNDVKHVVFQQDFTFQNIVTDCKAFSLDLFIIEPHSFNLVFQNKIGQQFLSYRKFHPPNLVQQDIVSQSVIRI